MRLQGRVARIAHDYALVIAALIVSAITAWTIVGTSMVVDGTRYFWLDDDQMISMSYARSLASGQGLVWNTGEHVEGYTSLGWIFVMAAVHLLPISDATTSLGVKIVAWGLACWVLVLTDRLLRLLVPAPGLARPAVLVALALSYQLVYWSVNAFETTLLTVLFLAALLRIVDDGASPRAKVVTFLLVGLLPVARSDAYHLCAALIMTAVGLSRDRRRLAPFVLVATIIPALQLLFRRAYYGEWLPNTYYLKVAGNDRAEMFWSGAGYLKAFVEAYSGPVLLIILACVASNDRRLRWMSAGPLLTVAYVLTIGADNFPHFRFLAPWVPVLFALGAAAAWRLAGTATPARAALIGLLVIGPTLQSGVHGRTSLEMRSVNGSPSHSLIAGLMIRQFTRPDATVAVIAAGTVPYFSHRRAFDLLGKTDARISHLAPHLRGPIGHRKFDIEYTLSRAPDLVVTLLTDQFGADPESIAYMRSTAGRDDWRVAMLTSPRFVADYLDQPVPLSYLARTGLIYVRRDSPEREAMSRWHEPSFSR